MYSMLSIILIEEAVNNNTYILNEKQPTMISQSKKYDFSEIFP